MEQSSINYNEAIGMIFIDIVVQFAMPLEHNKNSSTHCLQENDPIPTATANWNNSSSP